MLRRLASYGRHWSDLGRDAQLVLWYTAVSGIGFGITSLFSNLYILSLGYQQDFVGLLLTMNAIPAILLSLPVGFLCNRLGMKRTLVLGRIGSVLALIALSLSTGRPALIAARLLGGCAYVLLNVALFPLLTRCCGPESRAMLFSTHRATQTLASVVGSVVGGWLPAGFALLLATGPESALAYRATLLSSVAFMVLAFWPLLRLSNPPPVTVNRGPSGLDVLRSLPRWGRIITPRAVVMIGAMLFIPFMNVYFKEEIGVSNAELGTIFAVTNLIVGVALLGGPAIARRLGVVRAIVVLRLVPLPLMLILAFSRFLPVILITYWIRTAIARVTEPLSTLFVMEHVDEDEQALINGLSHTINRAGSSFMPYVSGLIQVRYGFSPLFLGAAVIYLFSAGLMHTFFGREDARGRSAEA